MCPFCNTLEKRPTYHMKKYHSESLINAETIFRAKLKDYLHSIRQQRYKDHQDPEDFKKCETKKKRASRQKLKKMNPKKAKAKVKRENDRRKGKINGGTLWPCAICHKPRNEFVQIDSRVRKRLIKEKSCAAFKEAQMEKSIEEEQDVIQKLKGERGTKIVVDNKEEAVTESDSEYGGVWEDESDLEEDVDWVQVSPKWLLPWTSTLKKEYDRIKKIIQWNIEKGTREKDVRLRWKLRKVDKYVDWLWLNVHKMWKFQEGGTKDNCTEDEDKEFLTNHTSDVFEDLLSVEYWHIIKRSCIPCELPTFQ